MFYKIIQYVFLTILSTFPATFKELWIYNWRLLHSASPLNIPRCIEDSSCWTYPNALPHTTLFNCVLNAFFLGNDMAGGTIICKYLCPLHICKKQKTEYWATWSSTINSLLITNFTINHYFLPSALVSFGSHLLISFWSNTPLLLNIPLCKFLPTSMQTSSNSCPHWLHFSLSHKF